MQDRVQPSAADVAAWMWATVRAKSELEFRSAADLIREKFGPAFVERTPLGRPTIRQDVRDLFNELHGGAVVRGAGRWYLRGRPDYQARAALPRPRPAW